MCERIRITEEQAYNTGWNLAEIVRLRRNWCPRSPHAEWGRPHRHQVRQ